METEIQLHKQEFQELVINWLVMLVNQALTLANQQELQTETSFVLEFPQLVLWLLVKTPFVNLVDNQVRGLEEISNPIVE